VPAKTCAGAAAWRGAAGPSNRWCSDADVPVCRGFIYFTTAGASARAIARTGGVGHLRPVVPDKAELWGARPGSAAAIAPPVLTAGDCVIVVLTADRWAIARGDSRLKRLRDLGSAAAMALPGADLRRLRGALARGDCANAILAAGSQRRHQPRRLRRRPGLTATDRTVRFGCGIARPTGAVEHRARAPAGHPSWRRRNAGTSNVLFMSSSAAGFAEFASPLGKP
jgi:hypothetical protein